MKKLIFLLILVTFQVSFAQWEITSWKRDYCYSIAAHNDKRIMIIGNESHSPTSVIKVSSDGGKNWVNSTCNFENYGIEKSDIIGNTIIIKAMILAPGYFFSISMDFGKTWLSGFPGTPDTSNMVDYTIIKNNIFAGYDGVNGGLYFSKDSGFTWSKIIEGLPNGAVKELIPIGDKILVRINSTYFLSSDLGKTWIKKEKILYPPDSRLPLIVKDDNIFELTYGGLIHSSDYGESWKNITDSIDDFIQCEMALLGNSIVITSRNDRDNDSNDKIYISSDIGKKWVEIDSVPFDFHGSYSLHSNGDRLIIATKDSIFYTTNLGITWHRYQLISDSVPFRCNQLEFCGAEAYNANLSHIYKSIDSGLTWRTLYAGSYYGEVTELVTMNDNLYVATQSQPLLGKYSFDLYCSTDYGNYWKPLNYKGERIEGLFAGDNKLLIWVQCFDDYYSSDFGDTWKSIKEVWQNNTKVFWAYFSLNKIYTYSYDRGFVKSFSNGTSWTQGNNGLKYKSDKIYNLQVITDFEGHEIIYAYLDSMLFRSLNEGTNWNRIGENLKILNDKANCMDAYNDEILLYSGGKIYYSRNYGDTWEERKIEFELGKENLVLAIKMIDNLTFISTSKDGIFASSDRGITWKQTLAAEPNNKLHPINKFTTAGDYIFCSNTQRNYLSSAAIYRAKISNFLSAPDAAPGPKSLTISPNPAGDFISLTNYSGSDRRFSILNILGQEVLAGEFTGDRISVSALPPGAYIVRIGSATAMALKK